MAEAAPRHSTGMLAARLSILRLGPYESILRFLIWPLLLLNHYLFPAKRQFRHLLQPEIINLSAHFTSPK